MKKWISTLVLITFSAIMLGSAIASEDSSPGPGPAPNSGDGVSDGSGMDAPNGPNGDGTSAAGNGLNGPAPNSGDGVPDGSGMDAPNGPHGK